MTRCFIIIVVVVVVVVIIIIIIIFFFYHLLSITPKFSYMYTSWDTDFIEKISSEQSMFSLCSVSVQTIRVISVIIAKLLGKG